MSKNIYIFTFFIVMLSCQKERFNLDFINFNVEPIVFTDVSIGSVTASARIINNGNFAIELWGYVWSSSNENPKISNNTRFKSVEYKDTNTLQLVINELSPATTYYVQAFVITATDTIYYNGRDKNQASKITTFPFNINTIDDIIYDDDGFIIISSITGFDEDDNIEALGIVWSPTNEAPVPSIDSTISVNFTNQPISGAFVSTIRDIDFPSLNIRAFIKYKDNYHYGESRQIDLASWIQLSPLTNNCNNEFTPINCLVSGVGFSIGKKGYIGTGERFLSSGTNLLNNLFWSYDTETGIWTRLSGNMRYPGAARTDAVAFVIDEEAFVLGGRAGTKEYKDVYRFKEGEGWSQMDDMPLYLRSAVAFTIGDKAYVGTGFRCDDGDEGGRSDCFYTSKFWEFDPSAPREKQWRELARCKESISEASGFSIGEKGYVSGGVNPNGYITSSWEFNPKKGELDKSEKPLGEWKEIARFPGSVRQKAVGFSLNGKGYIGTGSSIGEAGSLSNLFDFWSYDPNDDSWLQESSLGINNRDSAIGFVIKNEEEEEQAYIYGGFIYRNFQTVANDFWRYTPEDE